MSVLPEMIRRRVSKVFGSVFFCAGALATFGCGPEEATSSGAEGGGGSGGGGTSSGGGAMGSGGDVAGSGGASSATGGANGANGPGGDVAGLGGSGGGALADPPGTFLPDASGAVVFDIEAVAGLAPPSPWTFFPGEFCPSGPESCVASLGSGVYQFGGGAACGQVNNPDSGVMTARFRTSRAGLYRVAWRNLRDHSDGDCGDDRNNDSFLALPTTTSAAHFREPFKVFGGGSGTFDWQSHYDIHGVGKEPVCVEFDEGLQDLRISGRSRHHALDRVAILPIEGTLEDCRKGSVIADLDERPLTPIAE